MADRGAGDIGSSHSGGDGGHWTERGQSGVRAGSGVVIAGEGARQLFPWLPGYRWRKMALKAYPQGRQAYRCRSPGHTV